MSESTIFGNTGVLGSEPVAVLVASATLLIDAGVALAAAFDWVALTDNQATAIVAFVTAVSAVFGVVLRQQVYAPRTVVRRTTITPYEPPPEPGE